MPSILLVCTANICRSPMAEAILKNLIASRGDASQWRIDSAGTWANYGNSAAPYSQYVMRTMGMDISAHQSKPVTEDLIKQFDLVLTMTQSHKEGLSVQFGRYSNRIFTISEMIGQSEDIQDPIGGELADYQETANNLSAILSAGLDRICEKALSTKSQGSTKEQG